MNNCNFLYRFWPNLKLFDSSESENCIFFFWIEGVHTTYWIPCLMFWICYFWLDLFPHPGPMDNMLALVRFFISSFGCLNFENSRTRPVPLIMILVSVGTLPRWSWGGTARGRKWLLESLNIKKSLKETWLVKAPLFAYVCQILGTNFASISLRVYPACLMKLLWR
jgi:hypothetical protein